jgi:6,7-dimethyl-8-ribityllumazine synthase
MAKTLEGKLDGAGLRIGVVASRFNSVITERLLSGALDALRRHGVDEEAIEVAHVPGAFEIPLLAELMASSGRFDAVVCLGALVKGETPHFGFIAGWAVGEIGRLMLAHRVPVALGILTTNSVEQALERSGAKHGNKGYDAAMTAIEMANLRKCLA